MGLDLKIGEQVLLPPAGYKSLIVDADGTPYLLTDNGTREALGGGGGTVEGVTGDGVDNTDPANPIVDLSRAGVADELASGTDVRSPALVAVAQSISVASLTGNADGDYLVYFYLLGAATTGALKLQFNDADTNLYSFYRANNVSDAQSLTHSSSTCTFSTGIGAAEEIGGWIRIRSRPVATELSGWRTGDINAFSATGPKKEEVTFVYTDNSTQIVKLRLIAANTDSLAIGSYMMVRKLKHQF